jgi:hypothetical protein
LTGDEKARGIWDHTRVHRRWIGEPGDIVRVECFTNCDAAELFLNGVSLGRKSLSDAHDRVVTWDVAFEAGELSVIGYQAGEATVDDQLMTTGAPTLIAARVDRKCLDHDIDQVAHVEVYVLDAAGNQVDTNDNAITWTVDGPGIILGLENGDHASHEDYRSSTRRVYRGRQLGYIRTSGRDGLITITLRSPGLADAIVQISAVGRVSA